MEKKKKNLGAPRLTSTPFLLLWIAAHVIVWFILFQIFQNSYSINNDTILAISIGLVMGFGLAIMPKLLIRFTYHDTLKGWIRVTIIAWVIAWFTFYNTVEIIEDLLGNFEDNLGLLLIPLFVIPAIFQWFIIRRHTRQAWLWIVAGAVSAMAFGTLYGEIHDEYWWQFILGASAQGAVTGLSLLWLYGQSRVEKIKAGA